MSQTCTYTSSNSPASSTQAINLFTKLILFKCSTGPLIVRKILTIHDLWTEKLRKAESSNCEMGKKFLKTYLQYCSREIGPSFTRNMFRKFNMKWSDYMPEVEVEKFIQSNVSNEVIFNY